MDILWISVGLWLLLPGLLIWRFDPELSPCARYRTVLASECSGTAPSAQPVQPLTSAYTGNCQVSLTPLRLKPLAPTTPEYPDCPKWRIKYLPSKQSVHVPRPYDRDTAKFHWPVFVAIKAKIVACYVHCALSLDSVAGLRFTSSLPRVRFLVL